MGGLYFPERCAHKLNAYEVIFDTNATACRLCHITDIRTECALWRSVMAAIIGGGCRLGKRQKRQKSGGVGKAEVGIMKEQIKR